MKDINREKMNESILKGVEDVLDKTENQYDEFSKKASNSIREMMTKAKNAYVMAREKSVRAKESTEKYVQEHPEKSLLMAAGVGAFAALIAFKLMGKGKPELS